MVPQNMRTYLAPRAVRFILGLLTGWILVSHGVWAQQAPCSGCAPDSQPHPLSVCYITTATPRYSISDTDPQTAVNLACQGIADTYQVVIAAPCTLGSPPVEYRFSGGTSVTFRFSASFYDPRNGQTYTDHWNAPVCVCEDSLNPRNVGVGTDGFCHCKNGLQWDGQKRACVKAACPVKYKRLEDLIQDVGEDTVTATLTRALESGADGYNLLSQQMKQAEQCMAAKLRQLQVPYSGPTATVRTEAYQRHFVELLEAQAAIADAEAENPDIKIACAQLKAEIEGELGCDPTRGRAHCIVAAPARFSSKHTKNDAIDIPRETVNAVAAIVTNDSATSMNIETFFNTPYAGQSSCNVSWGGLWNPPDSVHFQVR